MVLDSQIGRPGANRRHMVSRRRRARRWPWVLAGVAGLALLLYLLFGGTGEPSASEGGAGVPGDGQHVASTGDSAGSSHSTQSGGSAGSRHFPRQQPGRFHAHQWAHAPAKLDHWQW